MIRDRRLVVDRMFHSGSVRLARWMELPHSPLEYLGSLHNFKHVCSKPVLPGCLLVLRSIKPPFSTAGAPSLTEHRELGRVRSSVLSPQLRLVALIILRATRDRRRPCHPGLPVLRQWGAQRVAGQGQREERVWLVGETLLPRALWPVLVMSRTLTLPGSQSLGPEKHRHCSCTSLMQDLSSQHLGVPLRWKIPFGKVSEKHGSPLEYLGSGTAVANLVDIIASIRP